MKKLILLGFLLSFVKPTFAMRILSEIDPPYNYLDSNAKPAGLVVEIVEEIQKRLGNTDKIEIYPWARAYQIASNEENVILFSMARTKERRNLFYWVGPVIDNSWVLIARQDSILNIASLEDAKKIPSIGVYRNDSRDNYLSELGFQNLSRSTSSELGYKMLMAKRISAYAAIDISLDEALLAVGSNINEVKILYKLKTVQVFITISKATPLLTVNKWKTTFQELINDGTYENIFKKYFPNRLLPGPMNDELL